MLTRNILGAKRTLPEALETTEVYGLVDRITPLGVIVERHLTQMAYCPVDAQGKVTGAGFNPMGDTVVDSHYYAAALWHCKDWRAPWEPPIQDAFEKTIVPPATFDPPPRMPDLGSVWAND